MRLQRRGVIHLCLGFVVHTRRYKQRGRRVWGSEPPINTPEKELLCLSRCESGRSAFSYSFQQRLLPCHTLVSFTACSILTFYTIYYFFISLIETADWEWESFDMFPHFSPLVSLAVVTSLPLSRSPSVSGIMYNPGDLQCPHEIKLATRGVRNTRDTLNIWAPFLASRQNSFHPSHWSVAEVLEDLEQQKSLMKCVALNCNAKFSSSHLRQYNKQAYIYCK